MGSFQPSIHQFYATLMTDEFQSFTRQFYATLMTDECQFFDATG